jgi:hypothetical protein
MESCPTEFSAEILEDLDMMERNSSWFEEHHLDLQGRFPDMFIAVHGDAVLFSASTLDDLATKLRAPGLPRTNQVLVRFVASKDTVFIL